MAEPPIDNVCARLLARPEQWRRDRKRAAQAAIV